MEEEETIIKHITSTTTTTTTDTSTMTATTNNSNIIRLEKNSELPCDSSLQFLSRTVQSICVDKTVEWLFPFQTLEHT
jgi:hypothetical protein